ncbi:MAG TPA: hypothetical protein VFJ90_07320, partial [Candidatus Didemnitutus sp.]|nr:hypothetical protein [Candidatus Didemnitutus sp.]
MPSPVPPSQPKPSSLHGNDDAVVERRSLRDYYVILRERLWVALPIALLVAVSVGYYRAQQTKMYSATATMQFERPERVVLNEQVVDSSVRTEIDLITYQKILESGKLRTLVAQSLSPAEVQTLQRPYVKELPAGVSPPPAGALLGNMIQQSVRNSLLISITVQNRDPEGAAILANRY